ncbi:MAG: hypothetical protein IJ612_05730 [Prevotella sp.]|nr:hypothetical protein [Prevotella sp.]
MNKLFSKLMLVALAAMTFAACEDVPEPYDKPGTGDNQPGTITEIEGGTGSGTLDDPYNAIAALNVGKALASGEETADYIYIKGKVSQVAEEFTTNYGNGTFYISEDGTSANQFYVYRALYLGNKKFANGDTQIKLGDEVVVCAKITNFKGNTIETVQNAGFLYSLNGENRGGEVGPSKPAGNPEGDGTMASPYNVAGVLQYIATLGSDINSPAQVYVKGKVSQVKEEFSTNFGNGTFYISDDGEAANEFYAYRVLYLGNKKFANGDTQIKQGDEVIICGNVVNYCGNTPETVQNSAFLYSLNGVTDGGGNETPDTPAEAKGDGTLASPYNAAGAIAYATSVGDNESDKEVYIAGKVSKIVYEYAADNYGNATFYISEDGSESNQFYCYRTLYLGNTKYTAGKTQIKKGDDVIIYGKVTCYMGNTPETVQNKAYLYSLNGNTEATEGGGGDDQPSNPVVTGNVAKTVSGTTMTLVYTEATESDQTVSIDFGAQGWSNAQEVTEVTLTDGTKITFAKGDGSNAPKYYDATKGMRLYAKNIMTITGIKPIAKVVIECDNYQGANVGNDALYGSVSGSTMTIVNEHTGTSGGSQFRPKTVTITYAQ